jgi:DNA integrity scanning protein DisA with diadenylate cyclase activity
MVFRQTINAGCCVWFILTQFFRELTEEEKIHSYLMQNGAIAHTANISLAALEEVFSKQLPTLDNSQFVALYISRFESE